jgi:hypothetical protein
MRSKQKLALILTCLSATAVFSTGSISTDYYNATHTSTLTCQPSEGQDAQSGSLLYTKKGLVNKNPSKTVIVNCPVSIGSETSGKGVKYSFHLVGLGTTSEVAARLSCTLSEVKSASRTYKQQLVRTVDIHGKTPKSLNWQNVVRRSKSGNSAFNIECKIPPKVSLVNITVRADII